MVSYSGFWGGSDYALQNDRNSAKKKIEKLLVRGGMRVVNELFDTCLGAAAGSAASKTHSRIQAAVGSDNLAGVRTIESQSLISRNSTAADVTELKDYLDTDVAPSTYPVDLAGNGAQ